MKEAQLHQAFSAYLDRNRLPYIHSRTDKRTSTKVGDPDYCICAASRCLFIEMKVGKKKLSPAQEERIAYLNAAGNRTVVAYSLEQAVQAVETWCGIEKPHSEALGPYSDHDWPGMKEAVRTAGVSAPKEPKPRKQPELPVNGNGASKFRIAMWGNKEWVMAPDMKGNWDRIREASAADVINFPRYGT